MSAKYSKILKGFCRYGELFVMKAGFCRYGVLDTIRCRQEHSSGVSTLLGQPTGYTHPHVMKENEITPGISSDEYTQRRANLINLVKNTHYGKTHKKHVLIFSASPEFFMGPDVPYSFRQNSNFLYLTGFQEPDAVLILEIGGHSTSGGDYNTILFTRPRDPSREIWDGPRSGREGAIKHFGFHEAYPIGELGDMLKTRYKDENCNVWYDHLEPIHLHINKEITDVLFNTTKFKFSRIHRVGHLVESLRVTKSAAEISLLKKSTSITSQAFVVTMQNTKPDIQESCLHNVMEHECKKLGANQLSFPPVVAGGSMANTLHYISNNQMLRSGQLVLVDSGCEYHGYSSDMTRVWPVNGKFTKTQRELYEVILNIQKNCIKLCQVGITLDQLYQGMISLMGEELEVLGLIPKGHEDHQKQQFIRNFCPHHIGHYLGMDVHDSGSVSKNLPLEEGMVICVEPGVYVTHDHNAPARFKGTGIRIEDDILITAKGPVVLTSGCPKEVDEIEEVMANKAKSR